MDTRRVIAVLPPSELLNRPPRLNLQHFPVSATIFELNQGSYFILIDLHLWMINANNPRKYFLLKLFLPQWNNVKSDCKMCRRGCISLSNS
ncbi:unnamed protein product [Hymenolepis diminuta]|uniref:Uncharacterized protein n=1 Tax=Hymenolepis diminuta TaxID=6216 RepID=A0A564ZEG2_HYMDI|nr:unnamed protein product [Hymenolepis diminuta]